MHLQRFSFAQILLASVLALSGVAAAEPPPPAAPSPQPIPYPNTAARDPATGLPMGKRMHKPLVVAAQRLEAVSIRWGAAAVDTSDRLSSDPEEGGEVTAAKAKPKPTVGEINVTHRTDSSSPKLMSAAPSGGNAHEEETIEFPRLQAASIDDPPPSGSATITVARGTCASGQHIKDATIVVRGRTFALHDVDVTGCTANADGTDSCTLNYASIGS